MAYCNIALRENGTPMNNGLLISIEGIDGVGKSTLANYLQKELTAQQHSVLLTKEPGATTLGKKLRTILHEKKEVICDLSEYLLFAADRAQHFEQVIIPALRAGKIIICDRMADSSVAYQGYGRSLNIEMIKSVNSWTMQNIKPNIIFYIKIDIQTALDRIKKRNEKLTSFEKEKAAFWEKVLAGYNAAFQGRQEVVVLDGAKSAQYVCKQAMDQIIKRMQK